ncbi:hypothetical protein G4B88_007487 [Cannabis sativa]|uniref:Uncharacterized protein n=1 Tax=Cannabis sativa TaxID=3483 RepID=A0A7J6H9G9_CANSA|nr:hypothetical protein G4B88_007487 [Cannabis sativa]
MGKSAVDSAPSGKPSTVGKGRSTKVMRWDSFEGIRFFGSLLWKHGDPFELRTWTLGKMGVNGLVLAMGILLREVGER